MTDTPLFADSLYGLRFWRVTVDASGDEWLSAPHQDTPWPPGGQWLHAQCPTGHGAPAAGCDCGAHAWHPRRRSVRDVLAVRGSVPGIVEAQGSIEVHEDGFRAERARPHALLATPYANRALIQRLADRYAASVVEVSGPRALLAYCRARSIGMNDEVVASLLGQGDPAERKRARFRQAGKNALRMAVAFAIAVAMVVLGLELAVDPPGDRTLFGRSGEVHTH